MVDVVERLQLSSREKWAEHVRMTTMNLESLVFYVKVKSSKLVYNLTSRNLLSFLVVRPFYVFFYIKVDTIITDLKQQLACDEQLVEMEQKRRKEENQLISERPIIFVARSCILNISEKYIWERPCVKSKMLRNLCSVFMRFIFGVLMPGPLGLVFFGVIHRSSRQHQLRHVFIGSNLFCEVRLVEEEKIRFDLSSWKYADLRDAINTSTGKIGNHHLTNYLCINLTEHILGNFIIQQIILTLNANNFAHLGSSYVKVLIYFPINIKIIYRVNTTKYSLFANI
uniref:Transmembrane protein n=1 Tax=Heterorhabditis bacteriophora TaxID=37862 RepID=A0A1I7X253_HETBA